MTPSRFFFGLYTRVHLLLSQDNRYLGTTARPIRFICLIINGEGLLSFRSSDFRQCTVIIDHLRHFQLKHTPSQGWVIQASA